MRVLAEDWKAGGVRVLVNDLNDLWHLENLIQPGDYVTAKTMRSIFVQRGEEKEKVKKKYVLLKIKVEKVEYRKSANKLRIVGKIVECPEDVQKGDYHAIEAEMGKMLTIEKEIWSAEQMERLQRARMRINTATDPKIVEEFFMHVNKQDGLATYGLENVRLAAEMGAVKIILIPDERIREKAVEDLARLVESKRGEIMIVAAKSEKGKIFCRQYDVAAILRFLIA
jgi:protein pelota